jgi:predicted SAM-dependent methyltransferase
MTLSVGAWLSRRKAARLLRTSPEIKLEIGAGAVAGRDGWTTVDLSRGADLYWNLLKPLPFPAGSVATVYSSHVLEHFRYKDLLRLLADCKRILKPGGTFSVSVPDASIYVRGYLDGSGFDRSQYLLYKPAVLSDCRMDIINYIAYMDGHHRYMFDAENLLALLARVGFVNVAARPFDPARDPEERRYESLYAVAFAPPAA